MLGLGSVPVELMNEWTNEWSREHWCNDATGKKRKYWQDNLSNCHFVQHTSQMVWLGFEPGIVCMCVVEVVFVISVVD